jgi:hypothetical protein
MEKKEKDEKTEITKNDIEVIQKIKEVQKQTEEQTAAMKKAFSDILNDILNIDVPTFLDKYGMLPSAQLALLIEFKKLQIMENIQFSLINENENGEKK